VPARWISGALAAALLATAAPGAAGRLGPPRAPAAGPEPALRAPASGPKPATAAAAAAALERSLRGRQSPSAGRWVSGVTITEYWPAPESWFVGQLVQAPGLAGRHRIDWLYSATGVSMQGEGIGLDGRVYHIDSLGSAGWVTQAGAPTSARSGFSAGVPYWRAGGYWAGAAGAVTFPLQAGGWSDGVGSRYMPLTGVTFAAGPSLPLRYYRSIAVDPRVIALGSRVYVPAYRNDGYGGWFEAQDSGGAIVGKRIDVYRSPPPSPAVGGQYLVAQRVFVIAPQSQAPIATSVVSPF
jgi:3D (Asp-Asp-Asp) domain-containing protein